MSFTKTTVITFANKQDSEMVATARHTFFNNTPTPTSPASPATVIEDGDHIIVKRSWTTESLANNWVDYMNALATKTGVTLVSAEVIDYAE